MSKSLKRSVNKSHPYNLPSIHGEVNNQEETCEGKLQAYFNQSFSVFELDLSNCTLVRLLEEYQKHKLRTSPNYSLTSILYNIRELESIMHLEDGITTKQVTDIFYSLFIQWLGNKGLKPSTIENYCSTIRTALTWGNRYNCSVSPSYDQFNIASYNKLNIALSMDEVSHIAHYNLDILQKTHNVRRDYIRTMKRVRDMFILSCNLGQRYSDMLRVNPSMFHRNIFKCIQQKTGNKAEVNIDKYSLFPKLTYTILERYGYECPYPHSIGNYNYKLHQLLAYIGEEFNEPIVHEYKLNGEIIREEKPKYAMISSHTARRTFISNNVYRGIAEYKIRKCSGHSDSRSFTKYICSMDGFEDF